MNWYFIHLTAAVLFYAALSGSVVWTIASAAAFTTLTISWVVETELRKRFPTDAEKEVSK